MLGLALLAALASAGARAWTVPLPASVLHPPRASHPFSAARSRSALAAWKSGAPAPGRVFSPLDYGGDPTGVADSTVAVAAATSALLAACGPQRDAQGVRDCGGSTLDLSGGAFLIAAPLVIPIGHGNFRIAQGTLRAAPSFPRDRFVVEIGQAGSSGGVIDVDVSEFFCDASQVAAGCILTDGVQGGVIGPQVYVLNFTAFGIRANGGFELTIQQTWAAEFWFGDPRKENGTASSAVGIYKDGNDGAIIDVVVFSAKTGVIINGGANIVDSVHTWSLANAHGGIGILVNSSQARIRSSYLDWQDIVFASPTMISFTGGFFLCGARIRFTAPASGAAANVYLADNEFISNYCEQYAKDYDAVEVDGAWTSVSDFTMAGTHAEPQIGVRSTVATLAVSSATPVATYTANLTSLLLFDVAAIPIKSIAVAVTLAAGATPSAYAALPAVGGVVTVVFDKPTAATVVITADQSARRSGA
jgi:hypothetical protein